MGETKELMRQEEYDWNKKEHLKQKNKPYSFSYKDFAIEYYQRLKKEYPDATIYYYDIHQYICLTKKARIELLKKMIQWFNEASLRQNQLATNIKSLTDEMF